MTNMRAPIVRESRHTFSSNEPEEMGFLACAWKTSRLKAFAKRLLRDQPMTDPQSKASTNRSCIDFHERLSASAL